MSSHRVNDGNALDQASEFYGKYMICKVGKRYRVYTDGSYYSQTSGGVTVRGKALRAPSGELISFSTMKKAEEWIDGGLIVFDNGKEIDFTNQ